MLFFFSLSVWRCESRRSLFCFERDVALQGLSGNPRFFSPYPPWPWRHQTSVLGSRRATLRSSQEIKKSSGREETCSPSLKDVALRMRRSNQNKKNSKRNV
ncbi:hypothetical protein CEXT_561631 [Caerostris extrusa]|uniref:Secreted protein n=1 Tax=Caerostris extrusa TaxID=172846 RepID=A0AAV4WLY6_CAEEX|nr:hypothetical protein CEXT_561631 [Caerostris extrusa]